MSHQEKLVSIIVPAYNAERYIEKCIDSILQQTYSNLELIVVDDGSTDRTREICNRYADMDSRILIIHKKNAGVSAARNTGIDRVSGDYIVFVDSDDWLDSNIIEKAVNNYKKDDLNIWGFTSYYADRVSHETLKVKALSREDLIANVICKKNTREYNLGNFFRASWGKIYDAKVIKINNIRFPENMYIGEDAIFLIRYLEYTAGINLITNEGYNYNKTNQNSATARYKKDLYEQCECEYKEMLECVNKMHIQENEKIKCAIVRYCWLKVTDLIVNCVRGKNEKQLSHKDFLNSVHKWINARMDILQKEMSTYEVGSWGKETKKLYYHRYNLNDYVLYRYYLIPITIKEKIKKILKIIKNGQ